MVIMDNIFIFLIITIDQVVYIYVGKIPSALYII